MSKNDLDKDEIVAFNNELLRIAIYLLPIPNVNLSAIVSILKEEIEKRTQDSHDPMVREKNAIELVRLFDDVFAQIKELKSELIHIKLENERLKEFLSTQRKDPANTNTIPL